MKWIGGSQLVKALEDLESWVPLGILIGNHGNCAIRELNENI
jgi:hypothetical protein